MRTLIVVPAFNEAAALPGVLRDLGAVHPDKDVVVVDDASVDDTVAVARRSGVRVVRLPINLGIGGAVKTGYKVAFEGGYDAAVQFDSDGQHRARDIAQVLAPIERGEADMVIGSRFLGRDGYKSELDRRLGIQIFSMITSRMTGAKITDLTSGQRAIGRRLIPLFARDYPAEFPDAEAIMVAARFGMRILEVPVVMDPRSGGVSSFSLSRKLAYPLKTLVSIAATALRSKKLYRI